MDAHASSKRVAARWTDWFSFSSNAFMKWLWVWALIYLFFLLLHPQRDGQTWNYHTITPGHNNGQFTARNVVTDAAHATHDGPSLRRGKDGNVFPGKFSFTSSVHFRGTFRRKERAKSSTFANFHPVEFSKKKKAPKKEEKKRPWTGTQIAVSYSELRLRLHPLSFQHPSSVSWRLRRCRMAFNFPFRCFGLWLDLNNVFCVLLLCMHECVCACACVCVCVHHVNAQNLVSPVKTLVLSEHPKYAKQLARTGQNVSSQAPIDQRYDLFGFYFGFLIHFQMYKWFLSVSRRE